jgi:hypothetical protein
MVKKMRVEFERGGKFVATLLEENAPKTCEKVWESLPIKTRVKHGQWSGQMFYCYVDVVFKVPENLHRMLRPGDISFNVHLLPLGSAKRPMKHEIMFGYGPAMLHVSTEGFPNMSNLFAHITEGDLKELEKIGVRILEQGIEEVVLTKA